MVASFTEAQENGSWIGGVLIAARSAIRIGCVVPTIGRKFQRSRRAIRVAKEIYVRNWRNYGSLFLGMRLLGVSLVGKDEAPIGGRRGISPLVWDCQTGRQSLNWPIAAGIC